MSDNCLHIVPIHQGDYPNAEQKAEEILKWFQDRDLVETEPSDCIMSLEKNGYRFKPNIASIFNEDYGAYCDNLIVHGLELIAGKRTVFHPMEGAYLDISCPNCQFKIDENMGYEWISDWYKNNGNDYPACPNCHTKTHLTEYDIEPEWAFSNIGISLWNTHWDLTPEFLNEMKQLFGTDVKVVPVRI